MTEWSAADYNRESSLQAAMAHEVLARLTLRGDERILDVGCGDGKLSADIARRVPMGSVLGIDPSRDMIAFASTQFALKDHPNLRFDVGDARTFQTAERFDLVVSFNALHWVPEQELALRAIRSVLASNGRALLRMVPQGPRASLEDVIEQVRALPAWSNDFIGYRKPYAHFTEVEYRTMAAAAGLRVLEYSAQDKAWDFKTREGFAAFAKATFVEWTRRIPQERWGAFIDDVLNHYKRVAASKPSEANTFKFYQMDVVLGPVH